MKIYPLILLLFISSLAFTQTNSPKFGKVSIADFNEQIYSNDSIAKAVIISEVQDVYFELNSERGGFDLVTDRRVRIKILSKDGLEYGHTKILYQNDMNIVEELKNLKACTYNLENGKVIKTKMSNSSIFNEKIKEGLYSRNISLPKVKKGSIIEYKYKMVSNYPLHIDKFYFQREIPVKRIELNVSIPTCYNFKLLMRGYEDYTLSDRSSSINNIGGLSIENNNYKWVMEDLAAFKDEDYIANVNDYKNSIEWELSSIDLVKFGGGFKSYRSDWQSVVRNLNSNAYFGLSLNKGNFWNEIAEEIKKSSNSDIEKASKAYYYILNNMTWNDKTSKYLTSTLRKSFKDKTGNSADINLNLVVLLRKVGLDAKPVILSTRRNGIIHPAQMMVDKYNYVIAHIELSDGFILLDGTDSNCPFGILPKRCLNGKGRIIGERTATAVDLDSGKSFFKMTFIDAKYDENFNLIGNCRLKCTDYAALELRKKLSSENKEKEYIKALEDSNDNMYINEFNIKNKNDIEKALLVHFEVKLENQSSNSENIFLNPILFNRINSNPFKSEVRKFPVDFSYKNCSRYTIKLEIPENYEVKELPKESNFELPNNAGLFLYSAKIVGNSIMMTYVLNINKEVFYSDEYPSLRQFFDIIVEKQSRNIILTKKTS
ncbi:MAG: DUF3857 domain-containing protein [Marinifilaceae bacterium]|jgi:hypothetical protein|nr:DUF3857 domain-containing protein [Marinifilaceae bacterium]